VKAQELNFEGVEKRPLSTYTEKAYLDYSMYVILDRALPALTGSSRFSGGSSTP
jgi:topoisomerase-4 subunit A